LLESLAANFQLFLVIFARLAALFEVAPLFSSEAVPQPARLGFALFVAVLVLPWVKAAGYPLPAAAGQYLLLVAGEVLIGLIMGYFLNLIFAVFQAAGQYFSLQMGFGASEVFDPLAEIEVPLMGQFLNVVGMFTFLVVAGAQKLVLVGAYRSFQSVRAVDLVLGRNLLSRELIAGIGRLFADALTISFPILGTLLLSVAMGLLAKAAPQMNLLLMGFPFSIGVAFLIMVLAMPFLVGSIGRVVDGGFETLNGLFGSLSAARRAGGSP
jgi:flagellar biosynthetic protein FliR